MVGGIKPSIAKRQIRTEPSPDYSVARSTGGVESSNKESFEPEQQHFPSHLIPGTQHPSSTVTVTLTQSEDGTYFPPPHLIDELDAWELGVPPSLTINTLAPPSSGQLLLEIATESTSDGTCRTGASNEAASELPVPVNGTKYRVQQQLQLSSIQHRRHLVKPDELTTMTASNPSSFLPVTLSETQVLISSTSPPVSVVTIRSETPELPTPETGQWGTENGVYDPFQCSIGVVGFCIRFNFQGTKAEEVCLLC
ncbi:uncharacterized protein LOC124190295 [Daphnia pulex]|uniref:uncharacterized protein LOC124190295 n=1 Tax=Daphnia pulex TaxID=6669 RepID=UPI001EDCF97C|nr:uncharacterized protein LOC124190295 [Daphnia pulex]